MSEPQTVNLRVDSANSMHVHCSLFMNGALCGYLTFRVGDYQIFAALLGIGADHTNGQLRVQNDDRVFGTHDWAEKEVKP